MTIGPEDLTALQELNVREQVRQKYRLGGTLTDEEFKFAYPPAFVDDFDADWKARDTKSRSNSVTESPSDEGLQADKPYTYGELSGEDDLARVADVPSAKRKAEEILDSYTYVMPVKEVTREEFEEIYQTYGSELAAAPLDELMRNANDEADLLADLPPGAIVDLAPATLHLREHGAGGPVYAVARINENYTQPRIGCMPQGWPPLTVDPIGPSPSDEVTKLPGYKDYGEEAVEGEKESQDDWIEITIRIKRR